jgi:hypothetical protein
MKQAVTPLSQASELTLYIKDTTIQVGSAGCGSVALQVSHGSHGW